MHNELMMLLWASSRAMSLRPDLYDHQAILRSLPLVDADLTAVGRRVPWFQEWLAHNTYDDYWKAISNEEKFGDMEVAAFSQCGWYDAYPGSAVHQFQWPGAARADGVGAQESARADRAVVALDESFAGLLQHDVISRTSLGDYDFGLRSLYPLAETQTRWFDHHLKGIDERDRRRAARRDLRDGHQRVAHRALLAAAWHDGRRVVSR